MKAAIERSDSGDAAVFCPVGAIEEWVESVVGAGPRVCGADPDRATLYRRSLLPGD
jgi:hypothetical protein